jgi:hypothetical protein
MGVREKKLIKITILMAYCSLLQEVIDEVEGDQTRPFNHKVLKAALKTVLEFVSPYVAYFLRVDDNGSDEGQEESLRIITHVEKKSKEFHKELLNGMQWKQD